MMGTINQSNFVEDLDISILYDLAERDAKFKEIIDILESQKSEYH